MKVLILILSVSKDPYNELIKSIKNTWYSHQVENVRKIFYYGDAVVNKLVGDELYLVDSERYEMIGPRTLSAFEFVKDMDFDYIVRVNAGSFIHQENLLKFLEDKPRENYYAGIIGNYHNIEYASGSAYIISRDLVHKLVEMKNTIMVYFPWGELCIDDIAIGEMVRRLGVKVDKSALRISFVENIVEHQIGDKNVTEGLGSHNNYHYRLRSNDRRIDIRRMYELYNNLYTSNVPTSTLESI